MRAFFLFQAEQLEERRREALDKVKSEVDEVCGVGSNHSKHRLACCPG